MPFQIISISHRQIASGPVGNPWDVSSAALAASFNVGIPIEVYDITFSDDGTKMFYSGLSLNSTDVYEIYQFDLSIPWDETSHNNDYVGFSVTAQDDWVGGITFNSNNGGSPAGPAAGTKFYIAGVNSLAVYQYTLSTAWDLSTATVDTVGGSPGGAVITYSFGFGPPYEPGAITFDPSGTTMLVTDQDSGNLVYQYTLSTPWDVSSVSGSTSIDLSDDYNTLQTSLLTTAVSYNDDGTYLYVLGSYHADIAQLKLTTPYDITSYVHFTRNYVLLEYDDYTPSGMYIKPDGSKLWLAGVERNRAIAYTMTTPWDLTTIQTDNSMSVPLSVDEDDQIDINFSDDGTKMYILDLNSRRLFQFFLTTPWDVTTASTEFKQLWFDDILPYAYGFFIGDNGSKLYVMNNLASSAKIHQWTLTTPWDITTASNDFIIGNTNYGYSIKFSSDGSEMYTWDSYSFTENVRQQHLTTPWDVSTAAFVGSFDPSAEEDSLWGITLSTNGDKLYTVAAGAIYQYTLSPAWDISSAVYDNKSYTTTLDGPNDAIAFNTDGTKMYKVGNASYEANYFPTVNEYTLSTPWDISTAVLGITGLSGASGATTLDFNNDGTRVYVGTTGSDLAQYDMAGSPIVPYDISTVGPYSSASKYLGSQDSYPTGVAFSSDGLTMFIVGYNTDRVYQYSLTTAWSVSSATYTGLSFYTTSSSTPEGLEFSDDGLKMYVIKSSPDYVYQYNLTNPWDFTVAPTYHGIMSTYDSVGTGIAFKFDGSEAFISGDSSNDVSSFTLLTPWDVTTAGAPTGILPVGSMALQDIAVSYDGTKFYIVNDSSNRIEQWTMSTPWDVTTGTSDLVYLSTGTSYPEGLWFNSAGTKMYIVDGYFGTDTVYEYNLAVAWDLSTAYSAAAKAELGSTLTSVAFKPDGTVFYELTSASSIRQYTPTSAWNIPGAVDDGEVYNITTDIPAATTGAGLQISSDGTKAYVLDAATNFIYQISITPGWAFTGSPSEISYSGISYNVASLDTTWLDMKISSDGTKLYLMGDDNARIHQLTLSSAWDLSTVSAERYTFPTKVFTKNPSSFTFSGDGTILYIGNETSNDIKGQITLSTPWDLATAQYPHSYNLSSLEGTDIVSVAFSDDGFTMYMLADQAHKVYQLPVSTAWDPSTAILSAGSPQFNVYLTSEYNDIETGMFFGDSGTELYIVGGLNATIYQYTLSVAWDLSTATYSTRFDIVEDHNPRDVIFNSDGTIMYVLGGLTTSVYQYTLGTGWDLSSVSVGSPVPSYDVSAIASNPITININGDGTSVIVFNYGIFGARRLYQYDLATPYDITSSSYSGSAFDPDLESKYTLLSPTAMKFNFDGTKLFSIGQFFKYHILAFSTNTPWSLQAIQEDASETSLTLQSQFLNNITFNDDGTKMYMLAFAYLYQYDIGTPYDLTTASYNDLFLFVGPQEYNMRDLDFNDDGTKMYLVGSTNDIVYQYTLSTAWEIVTAKYDFVSVPLGLAATDAQNITFNSDGTMAYVIDDTTDTIYQYGLATAWQAASGSYIYKDYTLTEDTTPTGLDFNSTGTKMYVTGSTSALGSPTPIAAVYQYTLSSAWDISTASYDSIFLDVSTESITPEEVDFNDDGTKMYTIDSTTNSVYQYTLGSGWDLSTASYDSVSLSVTLDAVLTGLSFKSDGLKLYIMGSSSSKVYSYTLSVAWDISTAVSDTKLIAIDSQDTTPEGLTFNDDGTKMYMVGSYSAGVYEYTLGIPWDASTAEYNGIRTQVPDRTPTGVEFSADGSQMYVTGDYSSVVFKYTLGSPAYDLSTAVCADRSCYLTQGPNGAENQWRGARFSPDGLNFYVCGDRYNKIYQYVLSRAWDLATAGYVGEVYVPLVINRSPRGVFLKPDGTRMYVANPDDDVINQYTLATPWDVTSVDETTVVSPSLLENENVVEDIFFDSTGTKMYILGETSNSVFQYTLSIAWDVSTATADQVGSPLANATYFISEDSTPNGIYIDPTGLIMYICGYTSNTIYQYTLGVAWDITSATYSTKSFNTNSATVSPYSVNLSSDGTKLYVSTYASPYKAWEFTLGTPWDISTAVAYSFTDGSFAVGSQESGPNDVKFSPDGTKMYIMGSSSDFAHQYTLSPAWDVLSAVYDTVSFDLNPPEFSPEGFYFKPDGTRMFMIGTGTDTVYEYSMGGSPAWDLSTLVDTGNTFYVAETSNPKGIYFNSDGSKMYIIDATTRNIYQYTLSTSWDITTAAFASSFISVTAATSNALGLEFSSDGSKLYTVDPTSVDKVFELTVGTPWDITSAYYDQPLAADTQTYGVHFSTDGTKMFTSEDSANDIIEWSLSDPWVVASATMEYSYNQAQDTAPYGLTFNDDGTKMYISGGSNQTIFQYTLGTAWDLSTATYDTISLDVSPETGVNSPYGITFKPDGTRLYVMDLSGNTMYSYTISGSPAWDLSTAVYDGISAPAFGTSITPIDMYFESDGFTMYMVASDGQKVYQYSLSSAWDISTLTYDSVFVKPPNDGIYTRQGIYFKPDGTEMYVTSYSGVYQHNLSPAWDITSASYAATPSFTLLGSTTPTGVAFKPDGMRMFVLGSGVSKVYQFNLSSTWDISTAVFESSFYIEETVPNTFDFNADGYQMFIVGTNNRVYQYSLGAAWDITTATYDDVSFDATDDDTSIKGIAFNQTDGSKMYLHGSDKEVVYEYDLS